MSLLYALIAILIIVERAKHILQSLAGSSYNELLEVVRTNEDVHGGHLLIDSRLLVLNQALVALTGLLVFLKIDILLECMQFLVQLPPNLVLS